MIYLRVFMVVCVQLSFVICVSFVVGFALVGFVGFIVVIANSVDCCHWAIVYFIFFGWFIRLLLKLCLVCLIARVVLLLMVCVWRGCFVGCLWCILFGFCW